MKKIFILLFTTCCCVILFSACQKDFSNESGNGQTAAGSLTDSSGNCLPDTVIGTFYNGVTPGGDTAYVEIEIDVTKTGSYSIYSDLQNGFEFADSGVFTTTGINTIRLKPIGTPIIPVSTLFNINFDSSFCTFAVNVQDSTGTGLGGNDTAGTGGSGNWQFATDSGGFSQGTFTAVIFEQDTVFGGTDLRIAGYTPNGDSVISMTVLFSGNTITPGTYYTQIVGSDTHTNAIFAFGLVITGNAIYDALDNPGDSSLIGITITSYNSSTKVVTGTFSGKAIDEAYYPATIGIVNGTFTAAIP